MDRTGIGRSNQQSSCFGSHPRNRSEVSGEDRDSTEIEEADSDSEEYGEIDLEKGISPLALNPMNIKKHLRRGRDSEKDEFVEYFLWCVNEIRDKGAELEERLKKLAGQFGPEYDKWLERSDKYNCMNSVDSCSRGVREKISMAYRTCRGLGEGGDPPEKKKDLVTADPQAAAYPTWMSLQDIRVPLTILLAYGQILGVYPGTDKSTGSVNGTGVNGTEFNGSGFNQTGFNATGFNATGFNTTGFNTTNMTWLNGTGANATSGASTSPLEILHSRYFYEVLAWLQITCTGLTLVPYLVLHAPPQFRTYLRGTVEQNKARKTALLCFGGALRYMTSAVPTAADANAYILAMPKWRANQSKAARLDVLRMRYSTLREGLFFPVNMGLALLTSVNLGTGQSIPGLGLPRVSGSLQGVGGLAGIGQAVVDILQARCEYFSAAEKLERINGSIDKLKRVPSRRGINSPERKLEVPAEKALYAYVANSTTLDYQERLRALQRREKICAWIRGLKGVLGVFTSAAGVYFGATQIYTNAKAGIAAVFTANAATFISGQYYISSWVKMHGRAEEERLMETLHKNAQFIRINFNDNEIRAYMQGTKCDKYIDYKHLFQNKRLGKRIEKEAPFDKNVHLLLDFMASHLLGELNNTVGYRERFGTEVDVVEKIMRLPLITWLVETWGASSCEIEALLRACCDRAVAFQISTCRDMLAKSLGITLPVGRDDKEKRIKPSVLVLAKMRYFEVDPDADDGKTFERIKKDYTKNNHAASNWHDEEFHEALMLGTSREEFISAASYIYKRSKMPNKLLPEHIQFAKLMAVVEYAREERTTGLNAVVNAGFSKFDFPMRLKKNINREDFREFRGLVKTYAEQAISDRVGQARALKKLARNGTMQEFHKLFDDQEGNKRWLQSLKQNRPLFAGIILLVDRVDRNQPIFNEPPSSPRDHAPVKATTATNLRRMDKGNDDSSSDDERVGGSYTSSSSDDDESSGDESDQEPIQKTVPVRSVVPKNRGRVDSSDAAYAGERRISVDGPRRDNYNDDDNDADNESNHGPLQLAGRSTTSSPRTTSTIMSSSRTKYVDMLCDTKERIDQQYDAGANVGDRESPIKEVGRANMESRRSNKAASSGARPTTLVEVMTSSDSESADSETDSKIGPEFSSESS